MDLSTTDVENGIDVMLHACLQQVEILCVIYQICN